MRSTKILLSLCLSLVLMASACKRETPVEPEPLQPQVPQWAMFGKNLRNTSNAADPVEYYSGPEQGEIVWSLQFGPREAILTSPSIASDGTIYMATTGLGVSDSGFVYAINPDGTIRWQFTTERGWGSQATGAVGTDDTYFIGSSDKYFYAIDPEGQVIWKREFSFGFNLHRPAITKNGIIILSIDSGVIAINARTGDTIWLYKTPVKAVWGVSLDKNGNIYTGTTDGLLALTARGEKMWEFPTPVLPILEVVIANDGTILFTVTDSLLYAINPDGSLKWTFNLLGTSISNVPAIGHDSSIMTMSSRSIRQKLYRLDSSGQLLWGVGMEQLVGRDGVFLNDTIPIVDQDGTIYMAIGRTRDDNFYAITSNGEVKWSVTIENWWTLICTKPAISPDGTLYVAGDHSLNAIR